MLLISLKATRASKNRRFHKRPIKTRSKLFCPLSGGNVFRPHVEQDVSFFLARHYPVQFDVRVFGFSIWSKSFLSQSSPGLLTVAMVHSFLLGSRDAGRPVKKDKKGEPYTFIFGRTLKNPDNPAFADENRYF